MTETQAIAYVLSGGHPRNCVKDAPVVPAVDAHAMLRRISSSVVLLTGHSLPTSCACGTARHESMKRQ